MFGEVNDTDSLIHEVSESKAYCELKSVEGPDALANRMR